MCPRTYDLFQNKEDRRSAHKQLKAYLRGDIFYRATIKVVKDEKVTTTKVLKLVERVFIDNTK